MRTFGSGARSSEEKPRYDLCPAIAYKRWAQRMGEGARSHGERNYQRGIVTDAEFRRDRINHLVEHAVRYAEGDRSEDHLAAVMANASMLMWGEEQQAKGYDDARAELQPCRCGKMVNRPEQCDGPPCPVERNFGGPHLPDATGEPV